MQPSNSPKQVLWSVLGAQGDQQADVVVQGRRVVEIGTTADDSASPQQLAAIEIARLDLLSSDRSLFTVTKSQESESSSHDITSNGANVIWDHSI